MVLLYFPTPVLNASSKQRAVHNIAEHTPLKCLIVPSESSQDKHKLNIVGNYRSNAAYLVAAVPTMI